VGATAETGDETRDPSGGNGGRYRPVGLLASIGAGCARRHRLVIALWLVALVAVGVARNVAGGTFSDKVELSGTQAYSGLKLLNAHEPGAGGYGGLVVFHVAGGKLGEHGPAIESSVQALRELPHVRSASDPLAKGSPSLSADGRTGYSSVSFDVRPKALGHEYTTRIEAATRPARQDGVQVEYGGGLDELFRPAPNDVLSEVIGFGVALLVLIVGFASVAAAILPLTSALIAVLVAVGLLGIVAGLITFGTTAPTLALMIGLGVGIDYALFLTTRFRQRIMDGDAPEAAAGFTVATSGHAVLVAAGTVAVALLGLYACGITFIGQLGLAAVIAVVVGAGAALTLVPAGLGLLGRSIDRFSIGKPVAEAGSDSDHWHRYAATVARRPWGFLAAALMGLAILAIPLFSIELGHIDDGADPSSYTDHRAYALIASAFGAGATAPFTVVVDTTGASASATSIAGDVEHALKETPGIASATPLTPSKDKALLYGKVVSASTPQSHATRKLFDQLVNTTLPQALEGTGAHGYVAGGAATQLQFRDKVTARLPVVILVVVGLAFVLLMATFRSVLVALKAAIMNLLSIGAAYGVIVAVFQWGWGGSLLGVHEKVPIESYVPVLMFAIVFGLSMDYEVFLLSRIKESWDHTHDNTQAVAAGLASTARVISCAAIIMASVFLSFVLSSSVVIKMLAVGLSASVLVDATIVRLVLVPATMTLLGDANWWMPHWLDRVLPRIEAEGAAVSGG
jgi:RND superfamily putative drug exporter